MRTQPGSKSGGVARLQKDGAGSGKLAHEAFIRRVLRHDAAACRSLEHVLAVPGDQISVVYDVLFARSELYDWVGRSVG